MAITVSGMTLIPQDNNNACWYASAQMVIKWRRDKTQSTEMAITDPSEVADIEAVHKAKNGYPWARMKQFAKALGLRELPLVCPTEALVESWLCTYGPIWTDGVPVDASGNPAGTGHVVVLAGIRPGEICIYDPWPPNMGNVSWRPSSHLVGIQSDGANPGRDVCFLACP